MADRVGRGVACAVLSVVGGSALLLVYGVTAQGVQAVALTAVLIVLARVDLQRRVIPNRIVAAGCASRLFAVAVSAAVRAQAPAAILLAVSRCLLGGLAVAAPLVVLTLLFERRGRKASFGGGDIKMFLMIGLCLSWWDTMCDLMLSCVIGVAAALVSNRGHLGLQDGIPFAPPTAAATWLLMLLGAAPL